MALKKVFSKIGINYQWWISNPSTKKKLDLVLGALDHHKNEPDTYSSIEEVVQSQNAFMPDIHRCIDKLIKDGFVGEINSRKIFLADLKINLGGQEGSIKTASNTATTFYITIEGRNFAKKGGYQGLQWQVWRWKKFWTLYFFPSATILLAAYNIYLNGKNSKLSEENYEIKKRVTEIEKQVSSISNMKPLIQNFYILPDSLRKDSIANTKHK